MKSSVIFALILAFSIPVRAVIWGNQEVVASFTNPAVAITNFIWSDGISASTNGLGWDGATNSYKDFWIQSVPIGIGTSWRPTTGVGVTCKLDPEAAGHLFVRYSADKKHWSTWQFLTEPRSEVHVPVVASVDYDKLVSRYQKLDMPWKNDEEAAVKWILEQQPDFFEKHQPFIGYLQFRLEGSMAGSHRIKGIHLDLDWAVSGLQVLPPNWDFSLENGRGGPWRFEAK